MIDPRITIVLNGERRTVPAETALLALIGSLGLPMQAVMVEYNGRALLRGEWPDVFLADDDRVEILRIVAGG